MQIRQVNEEDKASIRNEWATRGATLSELSLLDHEFACNLKWFAVVDGDKTETLFDVRQAPNYIKNMKVIFAPDIDIDERAGDYNKAKPVVIKIVNILATILQHHFEHINEWNRDYIKIYSDHEKVYLFFYEFCKHLEEKYSDQLELKLYGKWIEIHPK